MSQMDKKSLRKRRPSGPAKSQDLTPRNEPDDLPPARPRPNARPVNPQMRKSRVEDKIKKRMSMRYVDSSDPMFRNSAIPDLPPIPSGGRTSASGDRGTRVLSEREMVREDPRAVDIDILQQDGFDPDACKLVTI